MPAGNLIIRVDASVAMGTGHVMRCLALAQALQDEGGHCVFAMAEATPAAEERVRAEKCDISVLPASPATVEDAERLVGLAISSHASWVVVDGYQFNVEYQRALKAAGRKVLLVDDTGHAGIYVTDLVLDQNAHASETFYQRREPYTRLLLGPRYAMLRREFRSWREWKREIAPRGRKVLATMGGSDPDNITALVIEALAQVKVDGLEAVVVVGGSNPHGHLLERLTAQFGGAVQLRTNVSNMPELMAWADIAISAAGTTCWEMCLLGLPAILIGLAENQKPIAQALHRMGAAIHLGDSGDISDREIAAQATQLLVSAETRSVLSKRARGLIDGCGAGRVLSALAAEEQDENNLSL